MSERRKLRIVHKSGYRYTSDVQASFNEVRMTPSEVGGQQLISHELITTPECNVQRYRDYWGAEVEAFDIHDPHRSLEVESISEVVTVGAHEEARGVTWEELARPETQDRYCEFLMTTGYVDDPRDRRDLLSEVRALSSPAEAIAAVIESVNQHMTYTPGVTSVFTTATEAWADRRGVCQDFAHVTLGLLRALQIPARYVSGYLHTEESAPGETVVGESHAWVEAWNGGWEAFDPTNVRAVESAHVRVAAGRDYRDVPPLKGLYAGGGSEALGVTVEITQHPDE